MFADYFMSLFFILKRALNYFSNQLPAFSFFFVPNWQGIFQFGSGSKEKSVWFWFLVRFGSSLTPWLLPCLLWQVPLKQAFEVR